MFCKTYYISLVIFFCAVHALAQPTNNGFKKAEGLNSNVVYSVMQDSKGFLWVGTEAGASRYDGYQFTHYTIEEGLADNDVFQIKEDSKGRIWFLTFSGKPSIYENGHILNGSNTFWLSGIQPKKLAKYLLEDKPNSIWYVTLDTAYHIVHDKVTEKYAPPQLPKSDQNIQHLSFYKDTLFLVCNAGVYNTVSHQLYYFNGSKPILRSNVPVFTNDEILFYVFQNKVYDFSLKTHANEMIYPLPEKEIFIGMFPDIYPDSVCISTVDHLYKLNTKTKQCTDAGNSITNALTYIIKDAEGNTWVSSLTKGLFMKEADANKKLFKINGAGLPENITAYSFSKDGNDLYIGYDDDYYILKKGEATSTHQLKDNQYKGKVQQIFALQGKLYCSFNHGIIAQLSSGNIQASLAAKDIVVSGSILYVARSSGILKIYKFFQLEGTAKYIETPLSEQRASKLLLVSKDSLFAGGLNGLQFFVREKRIFPLPWQNAITNASISKIIKTEDHNIVFSTEDKGLGIIYQDSIYSITKQNGLLSNSITAICSSQPGLIWLVTTKGINKLTYRTGTDKSFSYTIENYNWILDKDNQTINDILQSKDTLYLATGKGAYYHILTQKPSGFIPKIYINAVRINDSSYTSEQLKHLSYKENKLRINFIGLAFQANGKIKYRYKLEGTDTTWQETSNTFVEYPYLIPGHYLFVVTAALPDGSWNTEPASVAFTIQQPYWKSWWFILPVILFALLFIFIILAYFINDFRKKHRLTNQKLALDKQVAELEHQALRLQMNPHFIFNAIYAIQGFYASGDTVIAKQYIAKLAGLIRMILQAGRSNTISLDEEINILTNYLELFVLKYEGTLQYHFQFQNNTEPSAIQIPPMIIQPVLENALLHGITPLRGDAEIRIDFTVEGNILICMVTDNGVGRKKSQLQKTGIEKTSLGLSITEKRLQLLYTDLPAQPVMEIKDIDPDAENTGTIVILRIPLQ